MKIKKKETKEKIFNQFEKEINNISENSDISEFDSQIKIHNLLEMVIQKVKKDIDLQPVKTSKNNQKIDNDTYTIIN